VTVAQLLVTTTQQTATLAPTAPMVARGTIPVPTAFVPAVLAVGRSRATSSQISLVVTHANGGTTRWSAEEADARNLLQDLTFGTSAPGGFKDLSCSLLRDLNPGRDEALFTKVQAIGSGGRVLWEGRMSQFPRQTGTAYSVSPGAVGYSAHLQDDPSFTEVYVDRAPNFSSPPNDRLNVIRAPTGGNFRFTDGSASTGGLVLTHNLIGNNPPLSEAWYDPGPGIALRKVAFTYVAQNTSSTDPAWFLTVLGTSDRAATFTVTSTDLHDTGTSGSGTFTLTTPSRYVFWQWGYSNATVASPGTDRTVTLSKLAVYGNHGLTERPIPGEPAGFYASDIVADIVARAAPMLDYSTGTDGTIQSTTFVVPHMVTDGTTTAADAIQKVNAYHGWDWLVWEGPTFYFQPPGSGVVWQARKADGAQLSLEGDSADSIYDRVFVTYQDSLTGTTKIAAWPGSGFDVESAALIDTDPDNPVTRAGMPGNGRPLQISPSFPTNDAGAVELGALALAEANLAKRSGQITLQGTVRHPTRGMVPVAEVRGGDSIVFTDIADDEPRRIVETSYQHGQRLLTATVNSSANKIEALLERLLVYSNTVGS
jgi:hypothetical protein